MLFFTGFQRSASEIEEKKIKQIKKKKASLELMHNMVDEAIKILNKEDDISGFGKLLHENWKLKKTLSGDVSTDIIDDIYDTAMNNGAIGGKILGAGRGGFMLFFVKPEDQDRLRISLSDLLYVPFRLDTTGSQIIFYSRSGV
jgi:D-glycero-alpha-D-manno-heptose-7-phosphate kinase